MTLSTSAASKKWKKIHKAAMTVYIDALWIFFYRLFMFDAFVLRLCLDKVGLVRLCQC